MPRALTSILAASLLGLNACANINTIDRTTELESSADKGKAIHLDIQQRLLIVNALGQYCSEPSPDALAAYAAALGIGASSPASGSASAAGGGQSSAASVGLRTQSITLMRDALFRMCEAFANGAVGPGQIATLLGRSQDLTAVILAVEQLTGAVAANQVALTGTTTADASATALATSELLDKALANEERKRKSLEQATEDQVAAKAERDAADRALKEARAHRDGLTDPTEAQRREAEADVAFRQSEFDRAQRAVVAADERVRLRQIAYDNAQKTTQAIQEQQDASVASASAATSGSARFSTPVPRVELDKAATEAIAKSVQAMVQTVLAKEYTEDSCMAMITYLPRDFGKWTADQQANLRRVQDICVKLIATSINKRITTLYGADDTSDRIDAWLKTPGNRQRLQNWLDTQTPRINVFTLLQGSFRDLRERAIAQFRIP